MPFLLNLILSQSLFEALIKISENEIISGFVQELNGLVLRLFEKGSDLLQLVLKRDVLQLGPVLVGIKIEKQGELIGTRRPVDIGVDLLEYLFFESLFLSKPRI